jgi:hypothetical protein
MDRNIILYYIKLLAKYDSILNNSIKNIIIFISKKISSHHPHSENYFLTKAGINNFTIFYNL